LSSLGALGVVYGDIGTSPLYALKECITPPFGLLPTPENILGILSLIFWSLTMVVVVKYMSFVMYADNHGEGGIMALLALLIAKEPGGNGRHLTPKTKNLLVVFALFGTALLLADGIITPAISVLSAIEGLEVATPVFRPFLVPLTLVILTFLFLAQKRGTASVATVFGPIMVAWFVAIGGLGFLGVFKRPEVLLALNPFIALNTLFLPGFRGFFLLGSVVLAVTGAEALYADMGHFGREPIRFAWYFLAYPALTLSYFGQGALLLTGSKEALENPFYALAPDYFTLYPLVILATMATIVASQALISGAFSLARQAIQLGYLPRLTVVHTSSETSGQIYVPEVNNMLMIACCALVLGFQRSSNLAAAYGIAVTGTMMITTFLLFQVMRTRWHWPLWKADLITGLFLAIDIPMLLANLGKVNHGGWVPLLIGWIFFISMTTWKMGREAIAERIQKSLLPLSDFLRSVEAEKPLRVKGTAVFLSANFNSTPPALLHHFKHNQVLHEQIVLLAVRTAGTPEVAPERQFEVKSLMQGFFQIVANYGFMQTPNVPAALDKMNGWEGLKINQMKTSYFLGRESLLTTGKSNLIPCRKALFAFLSANSRPAQAFFKIPPDRVLELGMQIEI